VRFWALVPARGGSKSVPLKNLKPLGGRLLLDYGILAARAWGGFERIVCSTEHDGIAEHARALGIEVDARPAALAGDETPVAEVAREFLRRAAPAPDWLFLIQPTSPFLLPAHIGLLAERIEEVPAANSAQTITPVPHNHHAWNQRAFEEGEVSFVYAKERRQAFNKQRKQAQFVFGNLVAARAGALLAGEDFFAEPSLGAQVPRPYDLDVDSQEDFTLAEVLIAQKCVDLGHLRK
jgi:CMP-N-acetylneuraminic acid synthetase